ncbi:hypothetical protein ACTV1I_002545 [Cronobacter dublinensis]
MNNDELIAAGHELAKCLDNEPLLDIAKMIVRLADKLDVTTLALREKTKQCEQVAQAVGWVEGGNFTLAEAVAGHVSGLKAATQRGEEMAAENAALKAMTVETDPALETILIAVSPQEPTPATDAFIAEQRAQGVEMFSERQRSYIGKPSKNDAASSYCSREALQFAAQLRQGGAA